MLRVALFFTFLIFKLTLITAYFALNLHKSYSFLDDITYLTRAIKATEENLDYLDFGAWITLAGSSHFLYYMHNALSVSLFGPTYLSPIILNSLIWISTVLLVYKFNIFDITRKQSSYFCFFILFSPIFFTWNSFINTKDFLVIFLDVLLILCLKKISIDKFRFLSLFYVLVLVTALFFLRFYNAPLIIFAYLMSLFLYKRSHFFRAVYELRSWTIIPPLLVFFGIVLVLQNQMIIYYLNNAIYEFNFDIIDIARYILGPNPLNLDERYTLLFVAELFQKVLVLLAIFFAFTRVKNLSLMIVFSYITIISFTIAVTQLPELVGPRHRLQIDLFIHFLSFMGFLAVCRRL